MVNLTTNQNRERYLQCYLLSHTIISYYYFINQIFSKTDHKNDFSFKIKFKSLNQIRGIKNQKTTMAVITTVT
jgi:hypothetical protein